MPRHKAPHSLVQLSLDFIGNVIKDASQRLDTECPDDRLQQLQRYLFSETPKPAVKLLVDHLLGMMREATNSWIHTDELDQIVPTVQLIFFLIHPHVSELVLSDFPDFLFLDFLLQLDRFPRLKALKLPTPTPETHIEEVHIQKLASLCNLVDLTFQVICNDKILGIIGRNCTQLQHLDMSLSGAVTHASVPSIKMLQNLKTLDIFETGIRELECSELLDNLPDLKHLSSHCNVLVHVRSQTVRLKSLTTGTCELSNELLTTKCPELSALVLYAAIGSAVDNLSAMSSLRDLTISHCCFSDVESMLLTVGKQLTSLSLLFVYNVDLEVVGKCTRLHTLKMSGTECHDVNPHSLTLCNFENLDLLVLLSLTNFLKTFKIFMSVCTNLKTLILGESSEEADKTIREAVSVGRWLKMEQLYFHGFLRTETLRYLINSCSNLNLVSYSKANHEQKTDLEEICQYITENNLDIILKL